MSKSDYLKMISNLPKIVLNFNLLFVNNVVNIGDSH
jgi:hypothetical protein